MITGYLFAVVLCAVVLVLVFVLMRRRRLREKYAAIWIMVSLGVATLAIFPRLAFWLAEFAQVNTPANLLFALAIAVLLVVCIQLSTEITALEEETRTVAEEVALLRLELQEARGDLNPSPGQPHRTADEAVAPAYPREAGDVSGRDGDLR